MKEQQIDYFIYFPMSGIQIYPFVDQSKIIVGGLIKSWRNVWRRWKNGPSPCNAYAQLVSCFVIGPKLEHRSETECEVHGIVSCFHVMLGLCGVIIIC